MGEANNESPRKRRKRKEKRSRSQVKSEEQTPTVLQHTRSTCAAGSTKQARGNGGCARQQVLHSAAKLRWKKRKIGIIFFFSLGIPLIAWIPIRSLPWLQLAIARLICNGMHPGAVSGS